MFFKIFFIFLVNRHFALADEQPQVNCRADLQMIVKGLNNDEGQVKFDLASSETSFKVNYEGADLIIRGISRIKNKKVDYIFKNIPCGEYAIQIYHDENMNQTLDFNFLQIPKEQYGFSNCKGCVLPPKWEVAKFKFDPDHNIVVVDLD